MLVACWAPGFAGPFVGVIAVQLRGSKARSPARYAQLLLGSMVADRMWWA